ncbi:YgdI/YgdR family lipoprotein [Alginatibacterium sediminis]|uniref:YgdI/YgdR family lipoprotein n=1 Tax=Alginatibacterium sediminis TaxID=2164068 RepID=A0A420EHP8_9ALTE|nr:YgdI/YgdR family lipoprotein [Alginatibacterium sediminis]RKF20271.1 YgdI/YgdR family lipoprotein [Alginatibacterium sediminis]
MRLLAVLALSMVLAACSASQYIMSTNEGQMITSYGKPKLDDDTGMYQYKDEKGKKMSIAKDQVVQIIER